MRLSALLLLATACQACGELSYEPPDAAAPGDAPADGDVSRDALDDALDADEDGASDADVDARDADACPTPTCGDGALPDAALCDDAADPSFGACVVDSDCAAFGTGCAPSSVTGDCLPSSCVCTPGGWGCSDDCAGSCVADGTLGDSGAATDAEDAGACSDGATDCADGGPS